MRGRKMEETGSNKIAAEREGKWGETAGGSSQGRKGGWCGGIKHSRDGDDISVRGWIEGFYRALWH